MGSLKTIAESELVEKVYDDAQYWRPDDYESLSSEEQAIYNYDWVEPGVAAWNWLVYTNGYGEKKQQNDYVLQREYVDLAAEMGWKYTILDGGWNTGLDAQAFTEFVEYAHGKGVKVVVWCHSLYDFGNGRVADLRAKLDLWKSYGVDGIKIDFFDGENAIGQKFQGEDIDMIKWYEAIYQETAKRQMVVCVHGCNKPTGERRIYPNVISREAIRGNENVSVGSSSTINSLFIRAAIGPTDFTPVVNPLSNASRWGSRWRSLFSLNAACLRWRIIRRHTVKARSMNFINRFPPRVTRQCICAGELDGYYCAAVRSGEDWFVAGANLILESTVSIDFSFLGEGTYQVEYFNDDGNGDVIRRRMTVTADTKETVTMIANGGFAMRIAKA